MTTIVNTARWLYIDGKGNALINGKKDLSFDLPPQWNFGDLEYAFKEACLKFSLTFPDDEEQLHRLIRDAFKSFSKRNTETKPTSESLDNEKEERLSQPQVLVKLAQEHCKHFFKDQYGKHYTVVALNSDSASNYYEDVIPLESNKFERFLLKLYYESEGGGIAGSEAVNNATKLLCAFAEYEGGTIPLHVRVAWSRKDEEITYDLTNDDHNYIVITPKGWDYTKHPDVLFRRFNQKPQVQPKRDYPPDIFKQYLDLMHVADPEHRLLTEVWSISCLIPDIDHPINIIHGEKGSAKTTFCAFQKRLIDPDTAESLTIPLKKEECVQQFYHNYMPVYDNIKTIPFWFSDEICRAVTGSGNSKRALYTDDDDIIYTYKRCLMINGINNALTEPDALDRSVLTELARIPPTERKEKDKIEGRFEAMRPFLLGYMLDAVVKALKIKPTITLTDLPRMADFASWGEAISRALGYPEGQFLTAYYNNIGRQNIEAIEGNTLAQVIMRLTEELPSDSNGVLFYGTASQFLDTLKELAERQKINTENKLFPKSANALTRRLKPILSNFREGFGFDIQIERCTEFQGVKHVTTVKILRVTAALTTSRYGQTTLLFGQDAKGGDIVNNGGDIQKVSPLGNEKDTLNSYPEKGNIENSYQGGDSGDSGDILLTSGRKDAQAVTDEIPEQYRDNIFKEYDFYKCKHHPYVSSIKIDDIINHVNKVDQKAQ